MQKHDADEQSFDISGGAGDEFDLSKLPSLNSVISEQENTFGEFKKKIKFLSAEWGVEIPLIQNEDQFQHLFKKGTISFRDVLNMIKTKFNLKSQDGRMIRFIDADNQKIIIKDDFIIYQKNSQPRKFIIQVGEMNLFSQKVLGITEDFQDSLQMLTEICRGL